MLVDLDARVSGRVVHHRAWHWWAAGAALVFAVIAGVALGTVSIGLGELGNVLVGRGSAMATSIVWTLRAPRVVLAILVGAGLGMSGTVIQGTMRNPLAEPYLLGVSGGAAVGAVVAVLLSVPAVFVPIAAFSGSALAVTLALTVARGATGRARADARTLLMAGVVVGALANAVIMILLANAPPNILRSAVWWMMGSVGDAGWRSIGWLLLYVTGAAVPLFIAARDLDVLTLGDDAAAALGVDVDRVARKSFLLAALIASATVAAAGLIGFVGLIVPAIVRMAGLTQHRRMLPAAALVGATLVVMSDLVARIAIPPAELPLGAVTAVIGVPFFLLQLWRAR